MGMQRRVEREGERKKEGGRDRQTIEDSIRGRGQMGGCCGCGASVVRDVSDNVAKSRRPFMGLLADDVVMDLKGPDRLQQGLLAYLQISHFLLQRNVGHSQLLHNLHQLSVFQGGLLWLECLLLGLLPVDGGMVLVVMVWLLSVKSLVVLVLVMLVPVILLCFFFFFFRHLLLLLLLLLLLRLARKRFLDHDGCSCLSAILRCCHGRLWLFMRCRRGSDGGGGFTFFFFSVSLAFSIKFRSILSQKEVFHCLTR